MPISIGLLIFGAFTFDVPIRIRFEPRARPSEAERQRGRVEREPSRRLPPRLQCDVPRD